MDLNDRALHILAGMVIGTILGYVTRMLQEIHKDVTVLNSEVHDIKEEVDEIDSIVKTKRVRDERGFLRIPIVADIILITALSITVWAAWSTGETNNKLEAALVELQDNQNADDVQNERIQKVTSCTLEFTSKTIQALNERTTYAGESAKANTDVLEAQQEFLEILLTVPPPSDADAIVALRTYTRAVAEYNVVIDKSENKRLEFSYPTNKELAQCLGVKLPEVQEER